MCFRKRSSTINKHIQVTQKHWSIWCVLYLYLPVEFYFTLCRSKVKTIINVSYVFHLVLDVLYNVAYNLTNNKFKIQSSTCINFLISWCLDNLHMKTNIIYCSALVLMVLEPTSLACEQMSMNNKITSMWTWFHEHFWYIPITWQKNSCHMDKIFFPPIFLKIPTWQKVLYVGQI